MVLQIFAHARQMMRDVDAVLLPAIPFPIPTINTALLLTSGVTLTWAHHALREGKRTQVIQGLLLTILLGFTFMGFQAFEYIHAYHELNLKLTSGVYGSTFFLLTGYIMDGRYGLSQLLDEKSALTFHRMLHLPLIVLVLAALSFAGSFECHVHSGDEEHHHSKHATE